MQAPYGSWKSPISTDLIVAETIGIGNSLLSDGCQYWQESRPQEGGRNVIVRRDASGHVTDFNPAPFNARTRVHEYGGAAWLIFDGQLVFANFADQQLYIQAFGEAPRRLTNAAALRFADAVVDATRNRLVCVIEDHGVEGREAQNFLGAVDLATGEVSRLASGHDFYASPAINNAATELACLSWDHPNMPWDGTRLWLASMHADGTLGEPEVVAGGEQESVQQPRFAPDDALYFISDRNGWWNLYEGKAEVRCVCAKPAEFGVPLWAFGACTYLIRSAREIVCAYGEKNQSRLAMLDIASGALRPIQTPYSEVNGLSLAGNTLSFVGASPTCFPAVVNLDIETGALSTIRQSCNITLDGGYYSAPAAIDFATAGGDIAHGFYYPPANKDFVAPSNERPPLIVMLHGGPTSASHSGISLMKQFWTSRGFALLDVNYRGSTGYGRAYREKLNGNWGIADVEDTVHGARYLVEQGLADPQRLAIRGGSAGGYTTLAALTFADTFKAGASYCGVGDLEALARDTHKFESRYLDSLIGRYPQDIAIYQARSPLNHVDRLTCPVIFLQGLEDKVVPPQQAETMVEALKNKGIAVAYVPFEGEQHGFRKAENIKRSLELELFFYARVFGFATADSIEPIEIFNL